MLRFANEGLLGNMFSKGHFFGGEGENMRKYHKFLFSGQNLSLLLFAGVVAVSGCTGTQNGPFAGMEAPKEEPSALTPGMTKKTITKGQTKQSEIMQVFGPPDYVTSTSSGGEMWGYDRVSREVASNAFGIGILGGGLPGGALLGGIASARTETTKQTVRTMFLLVYFDKNDTVTDYKISATRF